MLPWCLHDTPQPWKHGRPPPWCLWIQERSTAGCGIMDAGYLFWRKYGGHGSEARRCEISLFCYFMTAMGCWQWREGTARNMESLFYDYFILSSIPNIHTFGGGKKLNPLWSAGFIRKLYLILADGLHILEWTYDDWRMRKLWRLISTWHWGCWLERGCFWGVELTGAGLSARQATHLKVLTGPSFLNLGSDPWLLLRWWTTGPDQSEISKFEQDSGCWNFVKWRFCTTLTNKKSV